MKSTCESLQRRPETVGGAGISSSVSTEERARGKEAEDSISGAHFPGSVTQQGERLNDRILLIHR